MKKIALLGLVLTVCFFISTPAFSVDCSKWFGKGYCVDYIKQKVGHKPSGNASAWPANISKDKVRSGELRFSERQPKVMGMLLMLRR